MERRARLTEVLLVLAVGAGCAGTWTARPGDGALTYLPPESGVQAVCATDADCQAGTGPCLAGHCAPPPAPPPSAGLGLVAPAACSSDVECPGGSCRAGACSAHRRCAFDSQCPGGSCQFGTCSPFARAGSCSVDSQCPGGSCRFGTCSHLPPIGGSSCAFDSQCPGGSCSFGRCSPFSKTH